MINNQEILFVVDQNNNPIQSQPRDIVHQQKLWHRTTNIYTVNNKKQILCQKRSLLKDTNPGLWETCAGGHVLENQDSLDCAVQELQEELGILVNPEQLIYVTTYQSNTYHDFQYNYVLQWTGYINDLKLEPEEVTQVQWFQLKDLKELLTSEEKINWSCVENQQDMLDWIDNNY